MRTALITGGSGGLGLELSKLFAQDGYRLLWVAKTEAELQEGKKALLGAFPQAEVETLALDLCQPSAPDTVWTWTRELGYAPRCWSTMRVSEPTVFQELTGPQQQALIQLNVQVLVALTHRYLPGMLARNEGQILNISSNTSLQPVPKMSTYAASKAFVKHFSESLHEELKQQKSKVRITVVCPAAIKNTAFQQVANMAGVRTFAGLLTTTPQEVARDAYRGWKKGRKLVLSGARLRHTYWLARFLPKALVQALLRHELERKS
ncbi:MAG: SDR family NAD(P)-dependent oxidoreductase [Microscillaceae bacterium]|nr:SDR family NAD(P)-dependent oxidoreductase [Microscillaceae bacterium]